MTIKQPGITPVTSGGFNKVLVSESIRLFLVNYANLYVTSQGHDLYVHVWTLLSECFCTVPLLVRPLKPCTDVASSLLVVDVRLDVRIACDGLQHRFQHAEYSTCDPLITQPLFIRLSNGFHCYSPNFMSFPVVAHTT